MQRVKFSEVPFPVSQDQVVLEFNTQVCLMPQPVLDPISQAASQVPCFRTHLIERCVSSSCYNNIPQTGWLINNRNLFLTVIKGRSLKSGCQHGQVLLGDLFWVADCQPRVGSSHGDKGKGSKLSHNSYMGTNPILEGSTFIPITSQRRHLLIPSH